MAPTVNATLPQERDNKRLRTGERKSDLVCRVKYSNTLPDIPFDLKFIDYPFPTNRYVQYKPTSLEKNYKYEILTEHDLGVNIDLIDPTAYAQPLPPHMSPAPSNLHPDDERLLEDDTHAPQAAKKSRHSHVNVSWLRRTEYISTELTRYQPQNNDKIEATVGYGGRRKAKLEEPSYTDRDSQLEAIERTFEAAKEPLMEHYSKPGVTAVEELPIFPDFDLWKYPCAQVIFDSDPAPVGRSVPAAIEEMSQAMIRGVMDESGEQFVAYFLPTDETLKKRKRDVDEGVAYMEEDEYEYLMAREYNWNVKNKASKGYEENYFFVVRNDAVYYNELETRVRLSKRRQKQSENRSKSRLVVTHRPLTAPEHRTHRHRDAMLQPPADDEEEEEEEEEDEEEELMKGQNEGGSDKGSDDEGHRSRSGSRSRSRSGSKSRSRSRSKSGSRSRSASGSPAARSNRSRSASRSRSGTRSVSRSRSRSNSGSRKSRSRSGSPRRSRSASGSPRKSRSRSRSASGSPRNSRSRSRSASGSPRKSRSRSASGSPRKSRSRSPSGSPARSKSGSRSRSRSRSASGSPAASPRSGGGSSPGSPSSPRSDSD